MSEAVYRNTEIVGVSEQSVSDAIEVAVARATKALREESDQVGGRSIPTA